MERRRTWLFAVVILLASHTALALTPDGLALMEFKISLTTTSPLLETWNASDVSPCAWGGITCTTTGDVQSVILPSQVPMLEGNISARLGKLKALEVLRIEGNLLSGGIPGELGNLGKLRRLSLSNQRLVGEVPLQLGNCSSLEELQLDGNHLSGDITRVLDELSKLPTIRQIRLDGNTFTGTFPPSIGNATTLTYLSVSGGLEGELPKEMGRLANLTTLQLKTNKLNGPIPSWLGNMAKMATLDLTGNCFVGEIPVEIGYMSSLQTLGLAENKLSGSIPRSLGNLVNLVTMELYANSLSGPISDTFTSLVSLRVLNLAYNSLTGPFPGNMSSFLEGVYLQNNSMSGPIPEIFMPNLTFFDVANNFFNGTLPNGLCQGGKLQWLTVSGNDFEGGIPANCAQSLVRARLSGNRFTSIPDGFGRNSSLEYIDVSNNHLTGPLPAGLGAGSQVTFMDLSGNQLTGNLSMMQFVALARNLSVLNLARNNFSGEIPASMAVCKWLFRVDLSYNALSGAVPLALANLTRLEDLRLQGNCFTSLDPRMYLSSWSITLRVFNLAENPWNAPIPSEVGALSNLQMLSLSHGGFTGPIPSELGQLMQLEILDLSHNYLTGEISSALGKLMTSLIWVDVSFNGLVGSLPQEWVRFLQCFPDSFKGNPGLCLQYDINSLCVRDASAQNGSKVSLLAGVTMGVVSGIALAFAILVGLLFCWRRYARINATKPAPKVDRVIKNLTVAPLSFTFENIMAATENLSDDYIIGRGYHGVVYKATLAKDTHIVIKRIVSVDMRTALVHKSFWKEIESLGNAKHPNLVRLLGFMQWGEVGFLLYDYVSNGDLRAALHGKERGLSLNWKERLRIAEGVAKGLTCLHHTYSPPIVHRDITSSNVLLDDDLEPQISDFGLSKVLQGIETKSQPWSTTSPAVLGTYGYIAPEVGYSTVVSTKLDVYSYGVLLLELITGKQPASDPSFGDALHVAAWVREQVRRNEGKMTQSVLDASLIVEPEEGAVEEMLCVQGIALLCARENPTERPAMKEVVEMFQEMKTKKKKNNG